MDLDDRDLELEMVGADVERLQSELAEIGFRIDADELTQQCLERGLSGPSNSCKAPSKIACAKVIGLTGQGLWNARLQR
jgi:hypothetical protein